MAAIENIVQQLSQALRQRSWRISTAESCTGGLIAGALTELAGSSEVFEFGWVTYANRAKEQALQVPAAALAQHGAVSEAVAIAMAQGAAARSEEHTSELQSRFDLVCRLLREKRKEK